MLRTMLLISALMCAGCTTLMKAKVSGAFTLEAGAAQEVFCHTPFQVMLKRQDTESKRMAVLVLCDPLMPQ